MTKHDVAETDVPGSESDSDSAAKLFAEEFGIVAESIGVPRMNGRLLGWLLICDPPQQSLTDLARNLGVSRASVSIATRLLQANGLIRRVPAPHRRGYSFQLDPEAFSKLRGDAAYSVMRRLAERGIEIVGDENDPRAERLRETRDFFAFVEREIPALIERYRADRARGKETGRT